MNFPLITLTSSLSISCRESCLIRSVCCSAERTEFKNIYKMAGVDRLSVSSVPKKVRKACAHCKKEVVSEVQCKKCDAFFHPGCLRQAATQKNAI